MAFKDTFTQVRETMRYYVGGTWRILNERPVFLWAQAIAFKVLVSIVPVIILSTGILGQVLRRDKAFSDVASIIRNYLPYYRSEQLLTFLSQFASASGTVTLIGALGLVFAAMTLLTTLRVVISSVFKEAWHIERSILKGYVFDLRMVIQVSIFFIASMSLSLGMQTLNTAGTEWLAQQGLNFWLIQEGWGRTFALLGLVLPVLLGMAVFFQLFLFVPKPRPPRRSALLGAGVTAILWEMAKHAFAFYAANVGRFERYEIEPSASPEGAISGAVGSFFGLLIVFVFWIYYSGIVMIVGAIVAFLHEKQYRNRRGWQQPRARRQKRRFLYLKMGRGAAPADETEPVQEPDPQAAGRMLDR